MCAYYDYVSVCVHDCVRVRVCVCVCVCVYVIPMYMCLLQSPSNLSFYRQITSYRMIMGLPDDERGSWANKSVIWH